MALGVSPDGRMSLKVRGGGRARPVCTVKEACSLLKRTRRQVYRHIENGILPSMGKVLGEWLLDRTAVERLGRDPLFAQPVPARLQPLFPEYRVGDLNAGRDRVMILARVLEGGGRSDMKWLLRRYGRKDIARFLEEDGSRLLSARALRLWALFFRVRPRPVPSWRRAANPWPETAR
ncbi:MAG: helix-turn-helix domain-containing protein [Elusimicrobiota bacterium]